MTDPGATSGDGAPPAEGGIADSPPPEAARWGFWATLIWALVVATIYAVTEFAAVLGAADWFPADPADLNLEQLLISGMSKGYFFPLASFLTTIICCGAIAAIVRLKKHARLPEYLGLNPVSVRTMLNWIGLFAILYVAIVLVLIQLDLSIANDFMSTIYVNAKPAWTLWLAVVVAVPLFEEVFFRGFLLAGFAASFMRPIGAVLVTTALWAGLHFQYDAAGIAVVFCFGLLLGAARLRTGSLIVPLSIHALENFLATAAVALAG
jgi:CAAX protease family protein